MNKIFNFLGENDAHIILQNINYVHEQTEQQ